VRPMSWTVRNIPDLTDRVAVVTGASSGLGAETARALAGAGARVVMAARDPGALLDAAQRIEHEHPGAALSIVPVDLASLDSVHTAARTLVAGHPRIDILVNNAGVMAIPQQRTADGFEMQMGVNHLGHFALTAGLLPALLRAGAARIVSITSTAHHIGGSVSHASLRTGRGYHPWRAYGRSKLAAYHFALGLHRLFGTAGVTAGSLLADPGLSHTALQDNAVWQSGGARSQRFFQQLAARAGMTPAHAARPQLRAATDPSARSGEFYANRFITAGPPVRRPMLRQAGSERAISRLWAASEAATGVRLDLVAVRQASPV
jgi:NAD(P)-dependent dehydrogenase (short-subunit alcohol dehydrogenase family)